MADNFPVSSLWQKLPDPREGGTSTLLSRATTIRCTANKPATSLNQFLFCRMKFPSNPSARLCSPPLPRPPTNQPPPAPPPPRTHRQQVVVELGKRQAPAGRGDRRSSRENCNRREALRRQRPYLQRNDDAAASGSGEGCAPPGDVIEPAVEEDEGTLLWRPCARDASANLARVFKKEGKEEAVREAATIISRRIEVMARGCAVLRVALEDLIEGKVCLLGGLS